MFELIAENMYGEKLQLTQNPDYTIMNIEGLCPPPAIINTNIMPTSDGSLFNSSRVGERNLVITLAIHGDIEQNRIRLYRYFRSKQYTKIYYKNETRDVYVEGYVDTFECNLFQMTQTAQISILCPRSEFKAIREIVTNFWSINSLFEFEFAIDSKGVEFSTIEFDIRKEITNDGDKDTGLIITLHALGEVVDPVVFDAIEGTSFRVNRTLTVGDVLVINTNVGEKSVMIHHDDGTVENAINYMDKLSTWFTLRVGANLFTYSAESGYENIELSLNHVDCYEGV